MTIFFRYILSFSITHVFFALFLFFGLGIFTPQFSEEQQPVLYPYIICLCIVGTLIQSLVFTAISRFTSITSIGFFVVALIVELCVANTLFYYFVSSQGSTEELKDSLLMNGCLVVALVITMLIKEYQSEGSLS